MFVQPIGIANNIGMNNNFQRKNNPNFTGYPETFAKAVKQEFTTKSEVASVVKNMITDIAKTSKIAKTYDFDHIQTLLNQKGLGGLLEELRNPNAGEKIQAIMEKAKDGESNLLASFAGDHLQLFNLGKHGFFKRLFNIKSAPRKFVLSFNHGLDEIAISLDKKGHLKVIQNVNNKDVSETIFHLHTDNIKLRKDLQSPTQEVQIFDEQGNLDDLATNLHNTRMEFFLSYPYERMQDPLDRHLF